MILRRGNIKRYYIKEQGSRVPKRSACMTEFVHSPPCTEGSIARPCARRCWNTPHLSGCWAHSSAPMPRPTSLSLAPASYEALKDFTYIPRTPKSEETGEFRLELTLPRTSWQQRRSGALRGLSVHGGHFQNDSHVLSPETPCCVGWRHTHSAGPLSLPSLLAGAPHADPHVVLGDLLIVCIREKSAGLLRCTYCTGRIKAWARGPSWWQDPP